MKDHPSTARLAWTSVIAALVAAAAACGSSSFGGGIAGTSSVKGPISGFGSVIVGDVEFDTDNATVTIESNPATNADLKLGMVAFVRGVVGKGGRRGVAETVAIENLVEGPIDAIDIAGSTLTLLGQQIVLDRTTVFDPAAPVALQLGDTVDVGGFFDAAGRIRATRVELVLADPEIELRGFIRALDATSATLRIADLLVRFEDAFVEGAPPGGLRDGLFVEIDADHRPIDGALDATDISVLDPSLMTEEGDGIDLEGFVTELRSDTELVLNGTQPVRLTPETRYRRGRRGDLVINARVEIDGFADADGRLIAREVEFLLAGG